MLRRVGWWGAEMSALFRKVAGGLSAPLPSVELTEPDDVYGAVRDMLTRFEPGVFTVEALCVNVISSVQCDETGYPAVRELDRYVAGRMLAHLLYWRGKSVRDDKTVWRSLQDWRDQLYPPMTSNRLRRALSYLLAVGVTVYQPDEPNRAFHYGIDWRAFLAVLAGVINTPLGLLESRYCVTKIIMQGEIEAESRANVILQDKISSENRANVIVHNSNPSLNQTASQTLNQTAITLARGGGGDSDDLLSGEALTAFNLLVGAGVYKDTAEALAREHGLALVKRAIREADVQAKSNKGGFIVAWLRNNADMPAHEAEVEDWSDYAYEPEREDLIVEHAEAFVNPLETLRLYQQTLMFLGEHKLLKRAATNAVMRREGLTVIFRTRYPSDVEAGNGLARERYESAVNRAWDKPSRLSVRWEFNDGSY